MSFNLIDIRGHQIWLTKEGGERTYRVTRQFYNEEVFATASLASTSWFDTVTSVGFVQAVSDSGVENFGRKYINLRNPGIKGIGPYEVANLRRSNVTSLSFEISGDGGGAAQFNFFIIGAEERPDSGRDTGSRDTFLGFDRDSRDLFAVHEFHGDRKFIAEASKAFSTNKPESDEGVIFVSAGEEFQYEPRVRYVLGEKGEFHISDDKPRGSN